MIFKVTILKNPISPVQLRSWKDSCNLQLEVKKIHVSEEVGEYIVSLVQAIRQDPDVIGGPSTRASVALFKGSRAYAFLQGRDFVLPDDIKKLALFVLIHRVRVKPEAEMDGVTAKAIVDRALNSVPVPKI